MPYRLTTATGDQTYDLRAGTLLVVGRALTSDIPVFDPTISRRHAEVVCGEEGVEVRDLGSSNGTFVNGAKVETARLSPGDRNFWTRNRQSGPMSLTTCWLTP